MFHFYRLARFAHEPVQINNNDHTHKLFENDDVKHWPGRIARSCMYSMFLCIRMLVVHEVIPFNGELTENWISFIRKTECESIPLPVANFIHLYAHMLEVNIRQYSILLCLRHHWGRTHAWLSTHAFNFSLYQLLFCTEYKKLYAIGQ